MLKDTAYHALADLIYKGALFSRIEIYGYNFVFKTVNGLESSQIKLKVGSTDRLDHIVKYNCYYMAYSVLMVDGENVLVGDREEKLRILYDFFKSIPYTLYKMLLGEVIELKNSLEAIGGFIDGFCYTQQSRSAWFLLGNAQVNDVSFSGIPGMSSVGLNDFQETWVQANRSLDEEDAYNKNYSLALLVASASNPKGSKKIRAQHDSNVQSTQEKRRKIAKEGFARKTNWSSEGWAQPVDTAEELVAELERQMNGLKDRHDLFVDEYLKRVQDESGKAQAEEEKKMLDSIKRHEHEPAITGSQRALSPEETVQMLESRGRNNNNLMIVESEEQVSSEDRDKFFKKVGSRILTPKSR